MPAARHSTAHRGDVYKRQVEDNIVYCEFVCNLLVREGFRTVQAFHRSTARKLLQQAADGDKMCIRDRIITQKWIAMFPEGCEAWAEQRRTGYPRLFPVRFNHRKDGCKMCIRDSLYG